MKFTKLILVDDKGQNTEIDLKYPSMTNLYYGINRSRKGIFMDIKHNGNDVFTFISAPQHLLNIIEDDLNSTIKDIIDTNFHTIS